MACLRGGAAWAPVIGSVPDLDEAAGTLKRSHGRHTEGKEALLDRVVCPARLSAVGKPTGLTPALLVGPPGSVSKTTLATAFAKALGMASTAISAPGVVVRAVWAAEAATLLLVTDELDEVGGRLPGLSPPPTGCWNCGLRHLNGALHEYPVPRRWGSPHLPDQEPREAVTAREL